MTIFESVSGILCSMNEPVFTLFSVAMIIAAVFAIAAGIFCGGSAFAPYFVAVSWKNGGLAQPDLEFSFLFAGNSTTAVHYNWCDVLPGASNGCEELKWTLFGLQIAYAIGGLSFFAAAAAAILKSSMVLVVLPLALTFCGGALFGFFYRALPLLQQQILGVSTTASVSWQFSYSSYASAAGTFCGVLSTIVAAVLLKRARRELFEKDTTPVQPGANNRIA